MNGQKQNLMTIQDYYNNVYPLNTGVKTRIGKGGYVLIHLPNHPLSFEGYYLLHRAVVEQDIGRFLYQCEQVHHIDRNRQNNELQNLKLYATQRNHLLEEHSNSKINDEALVKQILEYADDPTKSLSDLPCAPATARKILKHYDKEWISAATWQGCSEGELKTALNLVGKSGLAEYFGVTYQTIWRRFPHILVERKPPNYLDKHRQEIFGLLLKDWSFRQIAERFSTSQTVLSKSLLRWSTNGECPIEVARNVNARPKCMLKL